MQYLPLRQTEAIQSELQVEDTFTTQTTSDHTVITSVCWGWPEGMTGGHLLSPSIFKDQSKVTEEGTLASECIHTQHFSFEARTLLTSGVTDLPSNPRDVMEGSAEMAPGGMFSYLVTVSRLGNWNNPRTWRGLMYSPFTWFPFENKSIADMK